VTLKCNANSKAGLRYHKFSVKGPVIAVEWMVRPNLLINFPLKFLLTTLNTTVIIVIVIVIIIQNIRTSLCFQF